jgi:GTP diphosphokinase / guanosine-3',5'-bis(diphosphate) 3'-diphosphatase
MAPARGLDVDIWSGMVTDADPRRWNKVLASRDCADRSFTDPRTAYKSINCANFSDALLGSNGYNRPMTADNDTSLLIRAIQFAARKHSRQRRKDVDASPYINHPIALMSVLCVEAGVSDAAILSVAALHDTIEDTETTQEEIQLAFGVEIAMLIAEMTDDKSLPKAERKRLQIAHARHMSRDGALVKLADKICNLRDVAANTPVGWSLEELRDYFKWAKAVVDGLPRVNAKLLRLFEQAYERMP